MPNHVHVVANVRYLFGGETGAAEHSPRARLRLFLELDLSACVVPVKSAKYGEHRVKPWELGSVV